MNKNSKEQKVDQLSALEEVASHIESQSDSRRQFIKKAVATTPVILTVTSGPVWAAKKACTYSGQLSLTPAALVSLEPCSGEGCSPGFWKNHTDVWPSPFNPGDLFSSHFGITAFLNDDDSEATLLQVLVAKKLKVNLPPGVSEKDVKKTTEALINLGQAAVAALLNSASTVGYDIPVEDNAVMGPGVFTLFDDAYNSADKNAMDSLKDTFDYLNNQNEDCPVLV